MPRRIYPLNALREVFLRLATAMERVVVDGGGSDQLRL